VKNLKFAFSNFSTFLAELIQNSRRAGASMVDIRLEGKSLTVIDDGQGVQDFQKLFTIAESGWDAQTQSLENPFGMGFTSALFACEVLKV
ncbi:ATP-binding protein, partial [Proteus mirabilis]